MASFDLNSIGTVLTGESNAVSGVDFSGKSLKLNTEEDAKPIVDAINACPDLQYLVLTGNTLGVQAARAIAKALEHHPEFKVARFSDMFTGRMKTEIPPALSALGDGMIVAGARLSVLDLSDNAFGPIGVEGLARLLQSEVCSQLQELRLNNNGLGITGGRMLANALSASPRVLRVFIAGRNRLENDGATALAKVFQTMGTLQEVAMPQNGIYHAGITALSEAFKCNPGLATLNLNDNTIGAKGAAALAAAMPRLKKLRSINFGDCLLKSKGALMLAKGLKDNNILLESIDLSCNEIGRDACMEVVDTITSLPNSAERLNRVVLAGNSLGGVTNKKIMRDKLGQSAQLSDDEGSGDEYVTGSEEESDGENSDEENSEDSAPEDAQHLEPVMNMGMNMGNVIDLDRTTDDKTQSEATRFMKEPSLENFKKLGPNVVDVLETHILSITDPSSELEKRIEALLCVCGLSTVSDLAEAAARRLCRAACERAGQTATWPLANIMLKGLGLIKSENKDFKIRWRLPPCFAVLAQELSAPYFPPAVRDTLKFFIASKRTTLPPETNAVIDRHAAFYA